MSHALICFDCGLKRNRLIQPVEIVLTEDRKVAKNVTYKAGYPIIIGHRCRKCVSKKAVGGSGTAAHGLGWRRRFSQFIEDLRKRTAIGKGAK